MQRRAVCLVGYMGAGKTSVGRVLARRLGWSFIDLDDCIAAKAGRTVAEIFASDGEARFRQLEAETLSQLLPGLTNETPAILSLGGGAWTQDSIRKMLESATIPVVHLNAPVDELWSRTGNAGSTRPLRTDEAQFRDRYAERAPHYEKASFRVETAGKSIGDVATEIIELVLGR